MKDANDVLRARGADGLRDAFDASHGNSAASDVGGADSEPRQGADKAKPLRIFSASTLAGKLVPPRRWLVQDWVPWLVVTGLYGEGGQGKSLLFQQLQTSLALGSPWIGKTVEAVPSLGLYCEDAEGELHRRQADINTHYGCNFGDLSASYWMPRFGEDNLLMTFTSKGKAELTPFHKRLKEAALDLKVKLLGIDTVSDTFGGNENDRSQVRQYVQMALGSLARDMDGCVVANAHPSRSGIKSGEGDSGSTHWNAAFRSRLFLKTPESEKGETPDRNARILQRRKANYAAREDEIKLRWRRGVLEPTEPAFSTAYPGRPSAEEVFLSLLDATTAENRPVSDNSRAGNCAPKLFASRPDRDDYRIGDFTKAMERLFSAKVIKVVEYGRKGDLRKRIARNTPA